jgi:hypothetical protein
MPARADATASAPSTGIMLVTVGGPAVRPDGVRCPCPVEMRDPGRRKLRSTHAATPGTLSGGRTCPRSRRRRAIDCGVWRDGYRQDRPTRPCRQRPAQFGNRRHDDPSQRRCGEHSIRCADGFLDPNDGADPALQIAAATQRLRRSGGTGPNVLFIDDVQYLDTASIAVAHKLALESETSIMASLRTTDASNDALAELFRRAEAARLELRPLEPAIMTDLVTASLGNQANSDAVSSNIERAGGNPLFAAELAKAHLDGTPDGLTLHLLDLGGTQARRTY